MECTLVCGNCLNGEQCNHVNGSCPNGCAKGTHGDKCDKGMPIYDKWHRQRLVRVLHKKRIEGQ